MGEVTEEWVEGGRSEEGGEKGFGREGGSEGGKWTGKKKEEGLNRCERI